MFNFNEMENNENDDGLLEEGGEKKKDGEDVENWGLEADLEDEENMQ